MTSPYALRASCRGHEDDVRGVAICAPDVFATCSRDKTVRVWAEAIGEDDGFVTRAVCVGHTSFVTTVASIPPNVLQSLPDGGLVSGGRDKRVLVWNTHTGLAVHDFIGHALDVTAVAVLATGHIVSGAMDKTIKVWCAVTQKCVTTIDAHESSVLALLPLPGGGFLSGSADRTIKKWTDQWWGGPDQKPTAGTDSSRNQSPAATYQGHVDTVRGLALAPGVGFLSASHDCTARLWTFGGETVLVFAGHAALVYAVAAMANGRAFFPTHHSKKRRSMSVPD
jgi:phospholipase A-2-activating protein